MRAADNPFNTGRLHRLRFRFQANSDPSTNLTQLFDAAQQSNFCGAVIGPHGSGKTTLLADLSERMIDSGLALHAIHLNSSSSGCYLEVRRTLGSIPDSTILIIDGAEQISRFGWATLRGRIVRRGKVMISAHQPGLLPTLYKCLPSSEIATEVVRELLGKENSQIDLVTAELFKLHNGNMRDVLRALYDQASDGTLVC